MPKPRSLAEAVLNIERVLKYATQRRVLVGVPADGAARPDGDANNAAIAYWNEFGVPEANIPARPFLMPGIEDTKETIAKELRRAAEKAITLAAMDGDVAGGKAAFDAGMHNVGLKAVYNVRRRILSGPFEPLSERTLQARARRLTGSGKRSKSATSKEARAELASRAAGNAASAANAKPLYDTHSLFQSVNYIIKYR
jgi:hypothetical protein